MSSQPIGINQFAKRCFLQLRWSELRPSRKLTGWLTERPFSRYAKLSLSFWDLSKICPFLLWRFGLTTTVVAMDYHVVDAICDTIVPLQFRAMWCAETPAFMVPFEVTAIDGLFVHGASLVLGVGLRKICLQLCKSNFVPLPTLSTLFKEDWEASRSMTRGTRTFPVPSLLFIRGS